MKSEISNLKCESETSRARILNREFEHPEDGWYQVEPFGEHLNRRADVVQVIDSGAADEIVKAFRAEAARPGFAGMLIDHEHFRHQADKETLAYGWLVGLENREDGIYGQIRWTTTGRDAVDGGDYRFFSTEYDPKDLRVLNRGEKPVRVRPTRLDGLTLTNDPNNKGGRPITNRSATEGEDRGRRGATGVAATRPYQATVRFFREQAGKSFLARLSGADVSNRNNARGDESGATEERTRMKLVCQKLGLSVDASEDAVLAEVTKIVNRNAEVEKDLPALRNRVVELEAANKDLGCDQMKQDLDAAGLKEGSPVRNRLMLILPTLKNREERQGWIADLVPSGTATAVASATATTGRVLNRGESRAPLTVGAKNGGEALSPAQLDGEVRKVMNRDGCNFEAGFSRLMTERPELFAR